MHLSLYRQPLKIEMKISPDVYLLSFVLLETASTICLKKTNTNRMWFIPCYLGYGTTFYTFPKCFTRYSLSTAYAIWCGAGIILTTFADFLFYNEIITIKKILAMILIISGIKII